MDSTNFEDQLVHFEFPFHSGAQGWSEGFLGFPLLDDQQNSLLAQHNLCLQQRSKNSQKEVKQNLVRASNTIFKTGLSFYRKILLKSFRKKPISKQIWELYESQARKINKSMFPKLLALAQFYGLLDESRQIFHKNINILLQKKREVLQPHRCHQLERNLKMMIKSMSCENWQDAIKEYWGDSNQKQKLQKSIQEVGQFRQKIIRVRHQSLKKVQP